MFQLFCHRSDDESLLLIVVVVDVGEVDDEAGADASTETVLL